MPNYEKAFIAMLNLIGSLEIEMQSALKTEESSVTPVAKWNMKYRQEVMDALSENTVQNGSAMRFYVEDSAGYIQYYGEYEHKYFDSIQEARKAIAIWMDMTSRVHFPHYKIYNENGVFIERIDREPEDETDKTDR